MTKDPQIDWSLNVSAPIDEEQLEFDVFGPSTHDFLEHAHAPRVKRTSAPAWFDEDDELDQIKQSDIKRLRRITKNHKLKEGMSLAQTLRESRRNHSKKHNWANIESDDSESDLGFLKASSSLIDSDSNSLVVPQDRLAVSRAKNILLESKSRKPIVSLQFHPSDSLILIAGGDKRLSLHQVDGKENQRRHGLLLEDLPIRSSAFAKGGTEIIASGLGKHFYVWDLISTELVKVPGIRGRSEESLNKFKTSPDDKTICFAGDQGYALLLSQESKQLIGSFKMNHDIADLCYAMDGLSLWTQSVTGEIAQWDLRTRKCLSKFKDEGAVRGTSLCSSPNGSLLASGSDSGVVNLYKRGTETPMKTFMNLKTPISGIEFNHDEQLMAISSLHKKNAFRIVHIPSGTVFEDFPGVAAPLARVHSTAFSPHSGFLSIGNSQGNVLLYRLHHYPQL